MSRHSFLNIGRFQFDFGDWTPSSVMFMFKEGDFYREDTGDPEDPGYEPSLGYATTRDDALANLDAYGYTRSLLGEAYEFVLQRSLSGLREHLDVSLHERLPHLTSDDINVRIEPYIKQEQGAEADFDGYLALVRSAANPSKAKRLLRGFPRASVGDEAHLAFDAELYAATDNSRLDPQFLNAFTLRRPQAVSPEAVRVGWVLYSLGVSWHPEELLNLLEVLWFRLLIEASEEGATVLYVLDRIYREEPEEAGEAEDLLPRALEEMSQRLLFYSQVYRSIAQRADGIRPGLARALVRGLLKAADGATTPAEKGRVFEDLLVAVFGADARFEVVERRVNTGDEEIDLVVKNLMTDAFWIGLGSPLLLVECKNWKKPVGARELREFEGKIRNHRPLVRVGFFVSLNGYSARKKDELLRMSREDYTLVLLDRGDIVRFAESGISLAQWLEHAISRLK